MCIRDSEGHGGLRAQGGGRGRAAQEVGAQGGRSADLPVAGRAAGAVRSEDDHGGGAEAYATSFGQALACCA
eukprot:5834435-Pyramimonas_sp.AAC.1